jgi:glycine cleavage system regulatory protein
VRRLTAVLKECGVNLLQFASWCEPAPNTGETLFRAMVEFEVRETLDMARLEERLEALAGELAVDIELDPGA